MLLAVAELPEGIVSPALHAATRSQRAIEVAARRHRHDTGRQSFDINWCQAGCRCAVAQFA